MLLSGFTIYCLLPFFVYGANIYEDGIGASTWSNIFQPIYDAGLPIVIFMFFLVICFLLGKVLPVPNIWVKFNRPISIKILKVSALLLLSLFLIFIYRAKDYLFVGYALDYDSALMGPMATVNLISVLILLNVKQWRQSKAVEIFFSILLVVNSIFLLSMGGRMYVLAPLISLFLQYINTSAQKITSRLKLFFVFCFFVLVLLFVGTWRLGEDVSFTSMLMIGLAEPLLTSISMAFLYDCGHLNLFDIPYQFLSTIVNFMPSGIFPYKGDFMFDLDQTGNCLYSPFGAVHISAMLILNFGILGACIFIVIFSMFLKSLRLVDRKGWWLYYYSCGLLPFMFFRDGFQVFNKALVGSGILMALIMLFLGRLRVK